MRKRFSHDEKIKLDKEGLEKEKLHRKNKLRRVQSNLRKKGWNGGERDIRKER